MTMKRYSAQLPEHLTVESLARQLSLREEPLRKTHGLYMDTFDWRLHSAGLVALYSQSESQLSLIDIQSGMPVRPPLALPQQPSWPAELPPGPLRQQLIELCDIRALIPIAEWQGEEITLTLDDQLDKTQVRLAASLGRLQSRPLQGETESVEVGPLLTVDPLTGYEEQAAELIDQLKRRGCRPALPIYPDWCGLIGIEPGNYSNKPRMEHPASARTDSAVRALLHSLLDVMLINEPGVVADIDSEFLHDYRVAVRRSRSAFSQMKAAFPVREYQRFSRGLAWLGTITTPLRDLDVQLLELPGYRQRLPDRLGHALDPLEQLLLKRRTLALRQLRRSMASQRYATLLAAWRSFLESAPPLNSRLAAASAPLIELTSKRIRKLHRSLVSEGEAIHEGSHDEAYHDLRKSGKKLRYMMEFFLPLYPEEELKPLIAATKSLQSTLGELQDVHVQLAEFEQWHNDLEQDGHLDQPVSEALAQLAETLSSRQQSIKAAYRKEFEQFSSEAITASFKQLFGKSKGKNKG